MPLNTRSVFPPRGWLYTDRRIKLTIREPESLEPFEAVAARIQRARINNPAAGLNPSLDACEAELDDYTCKRLPQLCGQPSAPAATHSRPPCATCGQRRKR